MRIIDCHVHIVGNGTGGTGCWYRSKPWRFPLEAFMCQHIGLPISALKGDLEGLFVARLLQQVKESTVDTAVILAQEQVYDDNGKLRAEAGSCYVPNEFVLRLARENPVEFLPAVSIHPGRPDALEELEKCLAGGAVMMKCLPNCQNINCNDKRYRKFWERMAEAKLPLLAHTGGEHTLPVVRPEYADPCTMTQPLECGVTVIAAHCATRSGFDPQYFYVLVEMFRKYPNLYGDLSAFNVPIRGSVVPHCLKEFVVDRMIHGSDYPVPVLGCWAWMQGFISWENFRKWERNPNVIERDYQLKVAMGFPPETFTRINSLLRLPASK